MMRRENRHGEPLPAAVEALYEHCLSCHACRSVCPVHAATGRMTPLDRLRLAALGETEASLLSREIWFCLQCNRCAAHCPGAVLPSTLIRRLREESVSRGLVSESMLLAFEALHGRFQRVRWQMILRLARGEDFTEIAKDWRVWAEAPMDALGGSIVVDNARGRRAKPIPWSLSPCMTCGACSTVCPVTRAREVFDPVVIFRLVNLGQVEAILASPSLWLCLGCERCTGVCTQQVPGHLVIRALQDLSITQGYVPESFREDLWDVDRRLLPYFLRELEQLLQQESGHY